MYELNDYVVIVTPNMEANDEWGGEVEVKIAWNADNQLDNEDHMMMVHVTHMLAASLELAETDNAFAKQLTDVVERRLRDEAEEETIVESTDGNVIRINFNKTAGTA